MGRYSLLVGLFVFAILTVVVSCVFSLTGSRTDILASDTAVRNTLIGYASLGIYDSKTFEQYKEFVLPLQDVAYPVGKISDVIETVAKQVGQLKGETFEKVPFMTYVQRVGGILTAGTPFAGKVQANMPPKPDFINIYFLSRDPSHLAKNFAHNCEYIGYQNAIICDSGFIADYFSMIDDIKKTYDIVMIDLKTKLRLDPNTEEFMLLRQSIKQGFLIWVLGHEIGHAVLHKNNVLSGGPLHFDLSYSPAELEADTFVAEQLATNRPLATQFWNATGEFTLQEYHRLYRMSHPGRSEQAYERNDLVLTEPLDVSYSRYNVPVILRGLRILNRLLELSPSIDGTGYYVKVEANVTAQNPVPYGRGLVWPIFGLLVISATFIIFMLIRGQYLSPVRDKT